MFVDDEAAYDPRTRTQYCFCGLPADNEKHTLQRRNEDERAHEARKVGETE